MNRGTAWAVSIALGATMAIPTTAAAANGGQGVQSNKSTRVDVPVVDDRSQMDSLGKLKYDTDRPGSDGWVPKGQRKNELRKAESVAAASRGSIAYSLPPEPGGYPSTGYLKANQQGQQTGYWCGPATLVETLGQHPGATTGSQSWAASQLGTTTDGTSKDAMQRELNQWSGGFPYDRIDLPFTPSSTDVANFKYRLQKDVNTTAGIAGVAYEVHNGPRLVGHPNLSGNIYHYFNVRGYSNYADTTHYEDSATTVWSTVPAYSSISTSTVVTIMGGRGYHW